MASSSPTTRSARVADADAVVLVTEWHEFASSIGQVASAMRGDVLIDGRNALDRWRLCARRALRYEGIGRPARRRS